MNPSHDVLGIGNAIVDVLARTDDEFLRLNRLAKGAMSVAEVCGAAVSGSVTWIRSSLK